MSPRIFSVLTLSILVYSPAAVFFLLLLLDIFGVTVRLSFEPLLLILVTFVFSLIATFVLAPILYLFKGQIPYPEPGDCAAIGVVGMIIPIFALVIFFSLGTM